MIERSPYFLNSNQEIGEAPKRSAQSPLETAIRHRTQLEDVDSQETIPTRNDALHNHSLDSRYSSAINRKDARKVHDSPRIAPMGPYAAISPSSNFAAPPVDDDEEVVMLTRTTKAPSIKKEPKSPEVIVLDDNDEDESNETSNALIMRQHEWEQKGAEAASKQQAMEIEKIELEDQISINQARGIKSEVKLQPQTLDTFYEAELRLKAIDADLKYYEKQAELAKIHAYSMQSALTSSELRLATAHAKKAFHDGQAAFAKLRRFFLDNSGMERPASLEEWSAQM